MARIAGVDIPREKRLEIALTYIFGIGRTTSQLICDCRDLIVRASRVYALHPGDVIMTGLAFGKERRAPAHVVDRGVEDLARFGTGQASLHLLGTIGGGAIGARAADAEEIVERRTVAGRGGRRLADASGSRRGWLGCDRGRRGRDGRRDDGRGTAGRLQQRDHQDGHAHGAPSRRCGGADWPERSRSSFMAFDHRSPRSRILACRCATRSR